MMNKSELINNGLNGLIKKIDDLTDNSTIPKNNIMVNNTSNMPSQLIDNKKSSLFHPSPFDSIRDILRSKYDARNNRSHFDNNRRSMDERYGTQQIHLPRQSLIKPLSTNTQQPMVTVESSITRNKKDDSMYGRKIDSVQRIAGLDSAGYIGTNSFEKYQSYDTSPREPTSIEYVQSHLKSICEKSPQMNQQLYQRLFGNDCLENCTKNNGLEPNLLNQVQPETQGLDCLPRTTETTGPIIPSPVATDVNLVDKIDYSQFFTKHINYVRSGKLARLMDISRTPQKLKQRYLLDQNNIADYFEQKDDISNNYDITLQENINKITSMYGRDFLVEVLGTYNSEEAILKQCLADFPRQDIYINGTQILTIDELFFKLGPINKYMNLNTIIGTDINQYMEKYEKIMNRRNDNPLSDNDTYQSRMVYKSNKDATISLIMLCSVFICQSSFYRSFVHLHNKLTRMKCISNQPHDLDHSIISVNDETDLKNNIYLSDYSERSRVDFTITKDQFKCALSTAYKIIDITDENILFKINSETLFDIDNDICLIAYQTE
jgi:hypothetical protein